MGALANAASLIKDTTFQDWCMAGAAYEARQVLLEDPATPNHQARKDLATSVITDPMSFRVRFTVYLATDPAIAVKGATAAAVTEPTVLATIKDIWTGVAAVDFV